MPRSDPNLPSAPLLHSADDEVRVLRARLRHRERQIKAIRAISETLFSHDSVDAMLHQTLTIALDTLDAGAGSAQIYDAASDCLIFRCALGPAAEQLTNLQLPVSQGIGGRVFRTGQPDISLNASSNPDFNRDVDARTGFVTRAMVTVPIRARDRAPIGVIQMLNFRSQYDLHDLETLEIIASQAAIAIDDARREEQTRKAEMVSFIGDLSHDIKNMLTPIQTGMWTLDPMLRQMFDELDGATRDWPADKRAAINKATQITREEYEWMLQNALDAAARVRNRTAEIAGAVKGVSAPPRFETGDFNAACTDAVAALRLVAHDARVELQLDLDPNLPPAQFDRKQIDTALYNLINNAIPETPEGGTVTLRTRALEPESGHFSVEVADSGQGMPDYVREKLFTNQAVSTKPGGTGLGTRIVGDIVGRHRGTISVQSEIGKGTTFTILLPLEQQ